MKNNTSNLDLKNLLKELRKIGKVLQRYVIIIFIVALVSLYGFLILQISTASQNEPSQALIDEQLGTVKRIKIDQESIDKIQQLEDQNIAVQSLFEDARKNPFSE